ncbi:MAG: FAD-dependent oxidoreductase [Ramlibacter sp.]
MNFTHDLVVIGCGPAGMSAALVAADCGLKTLVLDEQPRPGGQIYRNITAVPPAIAALLGPDYRHGATLASRLVSAGIEVRDRTLVWDVAQDLTVSAQSDGRSFQVRAPQLIAATGAMERPSPLPGWTLPGVLNAGAAQIALKSAFVAPAGRVVLVGDGPLLLLVACQLLDAGASVAALVQTSPAGNRARAAAALAGALGSPGLLAKGLKMLWRLWRARVPMHTGATEVRIEGEAVAQGVSFVAGGARHRLDADMVLLHHGVVPNTQLSRLLQVRHEWSEAQMAWQPCVDDGYETSLKGFRVAGDGASIAGALAAEARGALAGLAAAQALGRITAEAAHRLARPWRQKLRQQTRIRPFLDALYRPPPWLANPADDAIVCRCEEVTAGRIREMVQLGCQGPNQTKFFSRCGMGPCQGRLCGLTVTQLLAHELGRPPLDIGVYRVRSPLKPIALASVAAMVRGAEQTTVDLEK